MYPSNGPATQGAFGQPPQTAFGQSPQAAYGQPHMAQYANGVLPQPNIKWSTGLCGCVDDVPNCCITCWCPCITFGQIAEIADRGATSCGVHGVFYTVLALTGCQWIYSCMYRSKMRQQYNLMEEPCNDCILHCCCERCALCQEYRELNKTHGFDMSLGWDGNMARQNQGVAMPPFAPAEMKR